LVLFSSESFIFPSHLSKLNVKIYKNTVSPVAMNWSVTIREEHTSQGVRQEDAEEDVWTLEEGCGRRLERTAE
jgi:hypothetical protein